MKLQNLKIKNFKGFEYLELVFNSSVTRFIGTNGSGKTSILQAIWALFKGVAVNDTGGNIIGNRYEFIGRSGASANIEAILIKDSQTGEKIIASNHITKSTNQIEFCKEDGEVLTNDWVKGLLDTSLMNAEQFCQNSPQQQAKILGIDTIRFDNKIKAFKQEYTEINANYRAIGELIDIEKAEFVDIRKLEEERDQVREKLNKQYKKNKAENEGLRAVYDIAIEKEKEKFKEFNEEQNEILELIHDAKDLLSKLKDLGYTGHEVEGWIYTLPKPAELKKWPEDSKIEKPKYIEEMPDDSELKDIGKKISEASINNIKALKYEDYLKKKTVKDSLKTALIENKEKQDKVEAERLNYIRKFNFGYEGLSVDEAGGLILNGRSISTYSKGEKELIVAKFAKSKNPELKLRLIDNIELLDEENQEKLINDLLKDGWQLLITEVGKDKKGDNSVLLRKCKIVDDYNEQEKLV